MLKRPVGMDDEFRAAGLEFAAALASALGVKKSTVKERTDEIRRKLGDDVASRRQILRWSQGESLLRDKSFNSVIKKLHAVGAETAQIREVELARKKLHDLWHGNASQSRLTYSSDREYFGKDTKKIVGIFLDEYAHDFEMPRFSDLQPFPAVIQLPGLPGAGKKDDQTGRVVGKKINSADVLDYLEGLLLSQEDHIRVRLDTHGIKSNWVIFQLLAEHLYRKAKRDRDEYKQTGLCPIFVDLKEWLDALAKKLPDQHVRDEIARGITEDRKEELLTIAAEKLFEKKNRQRPAITNPLETIFNKRVVFVIDASVEDSDERVKPLPTCAEMLLKCVSRLIIVEGPVGKNRGEGSEVVKVSRSSAWAGSNGTGNGGLRAATNHADSEAWIDKVVTHTVWVRPIDVRTVASSCRRLLHEIDPDLPPLGQLGDSLMSLGNPEIAAQVETLIRQSRLNANSFVSDTVLMACLIAEHLVDVTGTWSERTDAPDGILQLDRIAYENPSESRHDLPLASLQAVMSRNSALTEDFDKALDRLSNDEILPKWIDNSKCMTWGDLGRHNFFYDTSTGKRTGLVDSHGNWIVDVAKRGILFLRSYISRKSPDLESSRLKLGKESHNGTDDSDSSYLAEGLKWFDRFDEEAIQFLRFLYDGNDPIISEELVTKIITNTLDKLEQRFKTLATYCKDYAQQENEKNVSSSVVSGPSIEDLKTSWDRLSKDWASIEPDWKRFLVALRILYIQKEEKGNWDKKTNDYGDASLTSRIQKVLERQFLPKFQTLPGQSNYRYFGAKAGAVFLRPLKIAGDINRYFEQIVKATSDDKIAELAGCLSFLAEVTAHLSYRVPSEDGRSGEGDKLHCLRGKLVDWLQEGMKHQEQPGPGGSLGLDHPEVRHTSYHMYEALARISPPTYARWTFGRLFENIRHAQVGGRQKAKGHYDQAVAMSAIVGVLLGSDHKLKRILPEQLKWEDGAADGETSEARRLDRLIADILEDARRELVKNFAEERSSKFDPSSFDPSSIKMPTPRAKKVDRTPATPRIFDLASPIHSHIFDAHDRLGPLLSKAARTQMTVSLLADIIKTDTWKSILENEKFDPAALEVLLHWLRNETRAGFDFDFDAVRANQLNPDQARKTWDEFLSRLKHWYQRASKLKGTDFDQSSHEMAWEIFINCGVDPDGRQADGP